MNKEELVQLLELVANAAYNEGHKDAKHNIDPGQIVLDMSIDGRELYFHMPVDISPCFLLKKRGNKFVQARKM